MQETAWMEGNKQVDDSNESRWRRRRKVSVRNGGKDWKKKYGGAAAQPDFEFMREAVFQQLKGYDEDERDLQQLIENM